MASALPSHSYSPNLNINTGPSIPGLAPNPGPISSSPTPYASFLTASSLPPQYLEAAYLLGPTLWKASHQYPHAALYSLYIPPDAFFAAAADAAAAQTNNSNSSSTSSDKAKSGAKSKLPLIITVHGTGRQAGAMRDALIPLAERAGAVVLAPLFPMGVGDGNDVDGYKGLLFEHEFEEGGGDFMRVRYDLVLLEILEEIRVRWEGVVDTEEEVYLTGFSGGGQFAHRMWWLYPERWRGVSVGAPGSITGLDWGVDWPEGVRDAARVFGRGVEAEKVSGVADVQLVVGELDTEPRGEGVLDVLPGGRGDRVRKRAEPNRREVMEALRNQLVGIGVEAEVDVVPGVGHDAEGVFPVVEEWLERAMSKG
ncbi:uncharacterized protein HMPREF1541_02152 [Cyphellophora europaea CBS 101466]|uniref:Carboxylic ester hydrolase n=1 Tax=Cyphellophora europaea (strain CBS 101466) TaxID=1220924 RepID=W2S4X2_CYPE1|nr:uncharacterized protein HMPREF1541_02152 [Cyphellophora europaea CBS 101466]ETN42994.1 hypothetical protein HMPREF1541_02152 [Cyphellophora europaea CBS 101466]